MYNAGKRLVGGQVACPMSWSAWAFQHRYTPHLLKRGRCGVERIWLHSFSAWRTGAACMREKSMTASATNHATCNNTYTCIMVKDQRRAHARHTLFGLERACHTHLLMHSWCGVVLLSQHRTARRLPGGLGLTAPFARQAHIVWARARLSHPPAHAFLVWRCTAFPAQDGQAAARWPRLNGSVPLA